ncbi:HtaA domain-containing protein [Actinomadura roseirufa]|uniref:HtaA domain-containing protein n=1 Tax=Actinomadura roseirufa TaxID=2094049 RepID=UPI0010419B4B|nr:HtaA domain-containing protein [Actinomadura roseirufa]
MHNPLSGSPTEWSALGRGLVAMGSALIVTGLATGAAAALADEPAAPAAGTAPASVLSPVAAGHLDWRRDVPDPSAKAPAGATGPKVAASEGATLQADGTFRFPVSSGSYDTASGSATVTYGGSVVFTFPDHTVTLRNPIVTLNGPQAAVKAELTEAPAAGGAAGRTAAKTASPAPASDLLTLRTNGLPPAVSGRQVTWQEVPAALTPAGEKALGGDGGTGGANGAGAGTGDEVTVALTLAAAAPAAPQAGAKAPTTSTTTSSGTPTSPSSTAPSTGSTGCATSTPSDSSSPTATSTTTSPAAKVANAAVVAAPTTATSTPSTSTSPTGTPTDCPSSTAPTNGGTGPSDGGTAGNGTSKLPKTGDSFMIPLTLTGGAMVTLGGGTMLYSRRRLAPWR